jgi:glycerate kinase
MQIFSSSKFSPIDKFVGAGQAGKLASAPMRILIAPDKFKGTLSGPEAAAAIAAALEGHELTILPVADGGEGTARAIGDSLGGRWIEVEVSGPLGAPVVAGFSLVVDESGGGLAVMEMSQASGLALLDDGELDPWAASTRGTGELLLAARECGVDRILIGIGGSATNDGGAGMAAALGFRFLDADGEEIDEIPERCGEAVDVVPDLALDLPEITVACDVTNPLLGQNGATRIYGPQKGVTQADFERHEERLSKFADAVVTGFGRDVREEPGAGAAGGLGFGLMSFCDAELHSGFEVVADALGLAEAVAAADLVITGEGALDAQSLMGKAPAGVAALAREAGVPVVAFCGICEDEEALWEYFDGVFPMVDGEVDSSFSMAHPAQVLQNKVAQCRPMLEKWAP